MIDRTFIEKLEEMAEPKLISLGGIDYSTKKINSIFPPQPIPLRLKTLTAIELYIKSNPDILSREELVIHIQDQQRVILFGQLRKPFEQRNSYLAAILEPRVFPFGSYLPVESFIISLQTSFVQTETIAQIIKLVGNLADERITQFNDDGVTQKVTAKVGIARVAEAPVPSPVILQPYRTFLEVDQPASKFVFRIQGQEGKSPVCALFEADGGQWELAAMESIRSWLKERVPSEVTILA